MRKFHLSIILWFKKWNIFGFKPFFLFLGGIYYKTHSALIPMISIKFVLIVASKTNLFSKSVVSLPLEKN